MTSSFGCLVNLIYLIYIIKRSKNTGYTYWFLCWHVIFMAIFFFILLQFVMNYGGGDGEGSATWNVYFINSSKQDISHLVAYNKGGTKCRHPSSGPF